MLFFKGKRLLSIFLASYLMLCIFNCRGSWTSSSSPSSLNMLDTTASTRVRSSSVTFSSINLKREFYQRWMVSMKKSKIWILKSCQMKNMRLGFTVFFKDIMPKGQRKEINIQTSATFYSYAPSYPTTLHLICFY